MVINEYAEKLSHLKIFLCLYHTSSSSESIFSEMTMFRQSDCFIYWEDAQKGLTWGLNFITADDTSHFLNVVVSLLDLLIRYYQQSAIITDWKSFAAFRIPKFKQNVNAKMLQLKIQNLVVCPIQILKTLRLQAF